MRCTSTECQQLKSGVVDSRCLDETGDGVTDGMQIRLGTRRYPQRLSISLKLAQGAVPVDAEAMQASDVVD